MIVSGATSEQTAESSATEPSKVAVSEQVNASSPIAGERVPTSTKMKNVDLVWMSLAAFLAYLVGSGKNETRPADQSNTTTGNSDPTSSTPELERN